MMTIAELEEKTSDAYSYDVYGSQAWRGCIRMMRKRGYDDRQIEAVLRSKWTRWADDMRETRRGNATSKDLEKFLDMQSMEEVAALTAETFAVLGQDE